MDWSRGFSAVYFIATVDPVTWRDTDRVEVTGGTITREANGLMHAADVDCINYDATEERYIRIYLDARQTGDGARVALFTGLAAAPEAAHRGTATEVTVECYSVLKPAEDVLLPLGWYAPAGIDAGSIIRQLLAVIPAPVTVDESAPTLKTSIIADEDESYLSMAQKVAAAIGWIIRLEGDGSVHFMPKPATYSAVFDPRENDVIESGITTKTDWYSCPNVFRAVTDDLMAIARDDSEDSPLSTVNRGREIWMQDTSCDLGDDEDIAQYAQRRLAEEQQKAFSANYKRRFQPDILPGDIVFMRYPKQGLNGSYRVISQTIELGYGATTEEDVSNEH